MDLHVCSPHVWLNNTFTSFPALFRVGRSTWRDAGNSKSSQFHPLLPWQLANEHNKLPLLQCTVTPSPPPCCCVFVVSEPTWLTVKHMMTQPGGNEHSLFLFACQTQMDCEVKIIDCGWNRPEGGSDFHRRTKTNTRHEHFEMPSKLSTSFITFMCHAFVIAAYFSVYPNSYLKV